MNYENNKMIDKEFTEYKNKMCLLHCLDSGKICNSNKTRAVLKKYAKLPGKNILEAFYGFSRWHVVNFLFYR